MNGIFNFILDLHRTLTIGETGQIITGVASVLFALFMLTTGLYLWWPKNRAAAKQRFWFRWKNTTKGKRKNYDIHNISGFYFSIPLFLLGLTGSGFYFSDELKWVLNTVTFSETTEANNDISEKLNYNVMDFMGIGEALAEMEKHYPDFKERNMWMTDKPDGQLSFAFQKRTDIYPGADTRIFLRADPVTGKILKEVHPDKLPLGESIMAKWLLQVHFGEFGGITTRILWFFSGFLPVLLTYTGVKIWLGRKFKRKNSLVPKSVIGSNTRAT